MWVRRLRLWSGLVIALFVTMHLLNHAFGVLSLEAMDEARPYLTAVWWNPVLVAALYASLAVHFILALLALYRRRSLRMPRAEALQLGAKVQRKSGAETMGAVPSAARLLCGQCLLLSTAMRWPPRWGRGERRAR